MTENAPEKKKRNERKLTLSQVNALFRKLGVKENAAALLKKGLAKASKPKITREHVALARQLLASDGMVLLRVDKRDSSRVVVEPVSKFSIIRRESKVKFTADGDTVASMPEAESKAEDSTDDFNDQI